MIATVALFVALGGGAYAAVKLPARSVGSKQIRAGAVDSSKVKNESLLNEDFKPGQLAIASKGDAGPAGPPGPTASSFSSHAPAAVSIGSGETQVITLTDGINGGLLKIGFAGRILFSSSLFVNNTSASATSVNCRLKIAPQGGAFTPISNLTHSSLPSGSGVQIPLVGAVDEPAGTYNVQAACSSGGSSTFFLQDDLTALATAR